MPKMIGTGKDPLGRYSKGLIFDLEDNDPEMVADFIEKGWAELLPEEDHPGRTKTQIANSMVRGDALADPAEQAIAEEIGDDAHAIVHLEDPDASASDYDKEVEKRRARQSTPVRQVPADYEGGPIQQSGRRGKKAAAEAASSGDGESA